ncbi:MAG TPA: hypothetical protein VGD29_14015 [Actinoplanes sp.]|jgi:hypothetical protein
MIRRPTALSPRRTGRRRPDQNLQVAFDEHATEMAADRLGVEDTAAGSQL